MTDSTSPVLRVDGLAVDVRTRAGWKNVVQGFDIELQASELHGIVGESGCGKSLTANAIMGLVDADPSTRVSGGSVVVDGVDLRELSQRRRRDYYGPRLAMVFQEPMSSLNPVLKVGNQITESLVHHLGLSRKQARQRAVELLDEVDIPDPAGKFDCYPHQFSGGMRQRAMLAIALACEPSILIADEPTTALDVTVQARVLQLLRDVAERRGMTVLMITHDLGVVAELCHNVTVMYAGQVVERRTMRGLIDTPLHPYTHGLLRCVPGARGTPLSWIPGGPPEVGAMPAGCRFAPRCEFAQQKCVENDIDLVLVDGVGLHRCRRSDELDLTGRERHGTRS